MCRFNLRFLAALMTFGLGVLFGSVWIVKNHSSATPTPATSVKEYPFAAPVQERSSVQPVNQTQLPKTTQITLERTVCYGTCPDYKLTVSEDGTVVFEGREFVKTKGIVKSKISSEKVRQIISEFEKADYFSLKDRYQTEGDGCPEVWTDNPTVNTSIRINGKAKSISHDYGCQEKNAIYPKALAELEHKIDEIVGTKQWIK